MDTAVKHVRRWLRIGRRASQLGIGSALLLASHSLMAAGLMTPASGNLPALQIKQHHVEVSIEDGYAITAINQEFYNPNASSLEAIYSFPVPEKASVAELTYWVDGKPVTGEVLEKAQARKVYEQEKAQGREAAIAEQEGYRSFDTRVYPVLAQQSVKIRLLYIQPVHVDSGIGRYVYPLEEGGVDEAKLAFWAYNDEVSEAFSFKLVMRSSYPIKDFRLPQHSNALVTKRSAQEWEVLLGDVQGPDSIEGELVSEEGTSQPQSQRLDKDIVVYWRHEQGLPGSIDMISHKPEGSARGTFMMTVTPGDDLSAIQKGRDWVFVLDISGSMEGKYHSLVEGVNKGLLKLNPEDRFRIVLFNNHARELTRGYTAITAENIADYSQKLENTGPQGGTNLYAGLEEGIKGLDADRASAILLVTDGVANVGTTEKQQFLRLLEDYDVRLFSFVMGNSANRPLLEGMAKLSNGFAMNISNSDDIVGKLMLTADKLNHEAYRDISIDIDGVKVKALTPASIGSLYRGQQLIVFGHYWGDGLAKVSINGRVGAEQKRYTTQFEFPASNQMNPEIERLWAYASIEGLQNRLDYLGADQDLEQAIVDLAIEYGLVTEYTSMVVVRDEVFQQYAIDRKNADRVAMEQQAKTQREAGPVRSNRQDTQAPAFDKPRSYPRGGGGGGGAFGPWGLVLLLPLVLMKRRGAKTVNRVAC